MSRPTNLRKRARKYLKSNCEKCGTNEELTIDHIVPISKGGGNKPSNLQTLCIPCHKEKDRIPKKKKMLQITNFQNKWRIKLLNEEWEFNSLQDAEFTLKQILELKEKYGKISNFKIKK